MIISANIIRELIKDRNLIERGKPLDHYTELGWEQNWRCRLKEIEGHAFDVRLRKVFFAHPGTQPEIGEEKRVTPPACEIQPLKSGTGGQYWSLPPGFYLFQSVEEFRMPDFLTGILDARTTTFRSKCKVFYGPLHPGYNGVLTVGFDVEHPMGLKIEQGARFLTVRFAPILNDKETLKQIVAGVGDDEAYCGIWHGDKVSTNGLERAH